MHLPWIAVRNFRAAICAATRSSSAYECISGAIFSRASAKEAASFRAFHPPRLCGIQLRALHLRNYILRTGPSPLQLHHSLWLSLIEIQDTPLTWNVCHDSRIESRCNFQRKISDGKLHLRVSLFPTLQNLASHLRYVLINYVSQLGHKKTILTQALTFHK